jgi:predicted dehydrogenase
MRVEDRDFFGRLAVVEAPVPIPMPGTVLIRTAFSWKWPGLTHRDAWSSPLRVVRAGLKKPWRILQHGFRYLILQDGRGVNLALDHHLGAHEHYVKQAHTCFSVSGRIEESLDDGSSASELRPGALVAGFGFKFAPYASFHVASRQFLVNVPTQSVLTLASLLMPAAMVLRGMDRANSLLKPTTIVVIGWNGISRLAACYGLQLGARVVLAGTDRELDDASRLELTGAHVQLINVTRQQFSKLKGPALIVLGMPSPHDIPNTVVDALAERADLCGLWIQSAPCQWSREALRLTACTVDALPIPDPWNDANLDIRSEERLDVPAWASPENLHRTLHWLCRTRNTLVKCFHASEFYRPTADPIERLVTLSVHGRRFTRRRRIGVSFIGAGQFATFLIKYVLRERDVRLRGVVDLEPTRARFIADLYQFEFCSTLASSVFDDDETDCVFIVTDHHSHAELAAGALRTGKCVFVEKPPAIDRDQLMALLEAVMTTKRAPQVGYNRNFAPLVRRLGSLLARVPGPTTVHISRRPYEVPANSWYYWRKEGTRIVSNVCHFLDLAHQITGRSLPQRVTTVATSEGRPDENALVSVRFADGSCAKIVFAKTANPQEHVFVQRGGMTLWLRDYSCLEAYEDGRQVGTWRQPSDFGHAAEIADFFSGFRESRTQFYSMQDLAITSVTTFAARTSLDRGEAVDVDCDGVLRFVRSSPGLIGVS